MPTSLKIFGKTYNNVAGFKALDTSENIQTYGPATLNLQAKTGITASTSSQTITADAGYAGLSSVQINAAQLQDKSVTANGTITCDSGFYGLRRVTVNVSGGGGQTINNQDKTVTPTESQQSITFDSGFTGLGTVTVNRIPTNYLIPTGNKEITANGTNINVASYATVTVNVAGGGGGNYQTKTVTPTTSQQIVSPDEGYDALSQVTVNAIPNTYVQPTTTIGATTYRASTSNQTINSGTYHSAAATIAAVSQTNLSAENIKSGTTISISNGQSNLWSVTGTYTGSSSSVQYDTKTVTASDYPTSLEFTGMKGEPKFFSVRLNTSVSSSGSTTYYYIVNMTSNGTTTHGNAFRIGSTRQVRNITSGYSWSYSGTTLTLTSSAASRSASPGAFYSGSYELMYAY